MVKGHIFQKALINLDLNDKKNSQAWIKGKIFPQHPMQKPDYYLIICVFFKILMSKPYPAVWSVTVFGGGTFGRQLGHEGGVFMSGNSGFIARGQKAS